MASGSYIGIETGDGIQAVYCQVDGHPTGMGGQLVERFTGSSQVLDFIKAGDRSSLERLADGFGSARPTVHLDRAEMVQSGGRLHCEYAYLWDGEQWLCCNIATPSQGWLPVTRFFPEGD